MSDVHNTFFNYMYEFLKVLVLCMTVYVDMITPYTPRNLYYEQTEELLIVFFKKCFLSIHFDDEL